MNKNQNNLISRYMDICRKLGGEKKKKNHQQQQQQNIFGYMNVLPEQF